MKRILIIIILCLSLSLCACTKETIQLEKYITNADQVYTILYQYFNTTELTITESDYNEECGTEQYFFYVNGVSVTITCEDHIAYWCFIESIGDIQIIPKYDNIRRC